MEKRVENKKEGSGSTKVLICLSVLIVAAATVLVWCIVSTFTVTGNVKLLVSSKEAEKINGYCNRWTYTHHTRKKVK